MCWEKKKQKRLGKTSLITLMRISWISAETSWNARGQLEKCSPKLLESGEIESLAAVENRMIESRWSFRQKWEEPLRQCTWQAYPDSYTNADNDLSYTTAVSLTQYVMVSYKYTIMCLNKGLGSQWLHMTAENGTLSQSFALRESDNEDTSFNLFCSA